MIRFTLRQFRSQAVVGVGGLVVVAVVLLVTGFHLVHLYDTTVAHCSRYSDCGSASSAFLRTDHQLEVALDVLVIVVPALIGLFWGAPLVARELEAGTFRLAWTQSVTRSRWLAIKLTIVGLASMATAGLLSLMVSWWSSPLDRAHMTLYSYFDERGIVPIGYAAFAFALGITAGVLMRRTIPAMATTLAVFVAVRLAVVHWIRPHLPASWHRTMAMDVGSVGFGRVNGGPLMILPNPLNLPNAWINSTQLVNNAGKGITPHVLTTACPQLAILGTPAGPGPGSGNSDAGPTPATIQDAAQNCVTKLNKTYHLLVTYQPPSHYWPMQWIELGIFLAAALGLAGLCWWWICHRIS